jgi:formate hydrogenlyase subunit 3/multisubunit Na+/H+ antiporter MnhD subunit
MTTTLFVLGYLVLMVGTYYYCRWIAKSKAKEWTSTWDIGDVLICFLFSFGTIFTCAAFYILAYHDKKLTAKPPKWL